MAHIMDIDTHAYLLRQLKEMRQWEDLRPQMVALVDGQMQLVGFASDDLAQAVAHAVAELRPSAVIVQIDAYWEEVNREDFDASNEKYERGSLEHRFTAGDPNVHEALFLTSYDGIGHARTKVLPYDARNKVWLPEPPMDDAQVFGRVHEAVVAGWEAGYGG